jgi:hypothetical protein
MNNKRYQLKFNFWLNANDEHEMGIAELIDQLKQERSFSRAIRQGLQLWHSLKQRDISVLLELFPWVLDAVQNSQGGANSGANGGNGTDSHIQQLQAKIDTLTDLVVQNGTPGGMVMSARENVKQLNAPKLDTLPELEVKAAAPDKSVNANFNFLIASAAQIVGNFDSLPPDVIAYGLANGTIQPDKLKPFARANRTPDKSRAATEPGIKQIAGIVPIAAPVFDDLQIDF